MNYLKFKTLLLKRFDIPKERSLKRALRSFTEAERMVFYFLVTVFIVSGLGLLWKVNSTFLVEVPVKGGKIVEGVIGNPRFINPVLALSDADKNLTALVYSGALRVTSDHGTELDLAREVNISEDGLSYTVVLREDAIFHDGISVTADDLIFTIQKIADPMIKSPRRGNWDGVTVEKVDERTVTFHLKRPYAPFMENLTIGILPHHIWKNVSEEEFSFSQYNTLPIGSGPYVVDRVDRNSGGIPNYYVLKAFEEVVGNEPFVKTLVFRFYPSEDNLAGAYDHGEISGLSGLSPQRAIALEDKGAQVLSAPLPRVFGVFFNQNQSKIFAEKNVRKALDLASPKESIVANVLNGYATPIDGPLPAGLFSWSGDRATEQSYEERFRAAEELLATSGWKKNENTGILEKKSGQSTMELSFSISTGDAPELKAVARELALAWKKLGVQVEILIFETGELNQNVIRPRKFDALLFGEVVGRDADVYPFWHSSQRNDPGLNIALYANPRVDKLLEEARAISDPALREEKYKSFTQEVQADAPAVFLYSPSFLYILPEKVHAVSLGGLTASHDRFLSVRDWYIETDRVWEIFAR